MRFAPLALGLALVIAPLSVLAQTTFTRSVIDSSVDGPEWLRIVDIDGDGENDVLLAASANADDIIWYDNDGGTWTERLIDSGAGYTFVTAVDLDGDGDIDILSTDFANNDILWFESDGTAENPGFTQRTIDGNYGDARALGYGDINADGDIDVVVAGRTDDDLDWYESDGTPSDGGWTAHEINADVVDALSLIVIDVDGDTHLDVITAESGQVTWYENSSGDGSTWTEHSVSTAFASARFIDAGDLDGDGDTDISVPDTNLDDFYWVENTAVSGDGSTWSLHTLNNNVNGAWGTVIGDLDDDGDNDIIGSADFADDIIWFENTSGDFSTFTEHLFTSNNGPRQSAMGDLDGDYDTDFAAGGYAGDDLAIFLQDGAGTPPVTKPAQVTVSITDSTWTMMGIPVTLNTASDGVPNTLFDDDMTVDYTDSTWVISRFEADSLDYIRFAAAAQVNNLPAYMAPGYGYWFYHNESSPVTIDIDSSQFSGIPDAEVTLAAAMPAHDGSSNGYGMFANPFDTTYTVGDMTFTSSDYSWAQVLDGGAQDQDLNANIYTWDGTQYVATSYTTATIDAWSGFWLVRTTGSSGDIDVNFPTSGVATESVRQQGIGQTKSSGGTLASNDPAEGITGLRLMASAHDGRVRDTYNFAGFREQSEPGYDPHDAFEFSPPGTPLIQLYFLQDDRRFTNDLRGATPSSQVWDLDIRTLGLENETVTLSWETVGDLPSGTRWELSYRNEGGARTPIGYTDELGELTFTLSDEFQSFTSLQLRLVAADGSEFSADGLVPTQFGITRAYPNPFNSSLTVELTLPETRDVTLTVYDITGRQVATVARGPMTAGSHRLLWNAEGVATGVYFVQAHSALGTSVKKVSLVK